MNIITIDFETYYAQDFSLTKVTTEEYVRDDRFEVIGVAVKENGGETKWFTGTHDGVANFLASYNWADSAVLAHNAMFDAAILTWVFGIKPMAWFDTLCMARAIHGSEVGNSLAKLVQYYNLGEKGTEVLDAKGKRRIDFTQAEIDAYGGYCINDVELTYRLFQKLLPHFKLPELKLIDVTLKMFSDPVLVLDTPLLEAHLEDVKNRKERLLAAVNEDRESLMSNQKFAELLIQCGVVPPTKISPATGKETLAMAKSDEGFKALLEHPDERVQALVAARLGNKSTLEETRTERFIAISKRGRMPVPPLEISIGSIIGPLAVCVPCGKFTTNAPVYLLSSAGGTPRLTASDTSTQLISFLGYRPQIISLSARTIVGMSCGLKLMSASINIK